MTLLCLWQYLKPVEPGAIEGLSVPFAEMVERAVSSVKVKAKRRNEPGLIYWESKRGRWFANLQTEEIVFEKPRSNLAKRITAAVESSRVVLPADLDYYTEGRVREIGGVHIMGPIWLIPGRDSVLSDLGGLPGATVALLPVETPEAIGSLLSLLASRVEAESGRVVAESDKVQRETNRKKTVALREQAEGISRMAGWLGVDMTAIGEVLLQAEQTMRTKIRMRGYMPPLDFSGGQHPAPIEPEEDHPPLRQPAQQPITRGVVTSGSASPLPELKSAELVEDLNPEKPIVLPRTRGMRRR